MLSCNLLLLLLCVSVSVVVGHDGHPRGPQQPHEHQKVPFHNHDFDIPSKIAPGFTPVVVATQVSDVQLSPGSPAYDGQQVNRQYLQLLDQDRLVHNFLVNAGLPAKGTALGGWEAPDCELRGHFTGHFLSAVALAYQQYGDASLKAKGDYIVGQLAQAQAKLPGGYLSAFPTSFFDRLEALQQVWAPYYTIHKIMQGLLDQYQLAGNTQAWSVLQKMVDYFVGRVQKTVNAQGDAHWQSVLNTEYGGMGDLMYRIYAITGNASHQWLAHEFDHTSFLTPLSRNQDNLAGQHANTHLPQILAAARRYEVVGDQSYHDITVNFWEMIYNHRMYSTGGHNGGDGQNCRAGGEYWGTAGCLAKTLTNNNQETCTTYNTLKIIKTLITWTGNPLYMDHYERAYMNAFWGTQNSPQVGQMLYYTPLANGISKARSANGWGNQYNSFVCCYGTGVEQWSKMGDSIYFYSADGNDVYVNMFIPSVLNWKTKGVTITQKTNVPYGEGSASFTIQTTRAQAFGLHIHIPYWVGANGAITVNGQAVNTKLTPTSIAVVSRTWNNGDVVNVTLPMSIHGYPMPDNQKLVSVMYGPLVLGGLSTGQHTIQTNNINSLASVVTRTAAPPKIQFSAKIESGTMNMVPLYSILGDTAYGVYFNLQ